MKVFMSTWALNGGIEAALSDIDGDAPKIDRTSADIMLAENRDPIIATAPAW
jgi:hypothetical protein